LNESILELIARVIEWCEPTRDDGGSMQNRGVLTWSGWVPCSWNEGRLMRRLAPRCDHPTILHALLSLPGIRSTKQLRAALLQRYGAMFPGLDEAQVAARGCAITRLVLNG
jgi:hypothetical protein